MTKYEFTKLGKRYIVKNSNGIIVDEKTKLEMENKQLILEDIEGCNCQKETTKKLTKNKKRLKEIEQEEKETAPETNGADVDDIIKETDTTI